MASTELILVDADLFAWDREEEKFVPSCQNVKVILSAETVAASASSSAKQSVSTIREYMLKVTVDTPGPDDSAKPTPSSADAFAATLMAQPRRKLLLQQRIADDMRHQFFAKELSMVWVLVMGAESEGGEDTKSHEQAELAQCFSLKFRNAGEFVQMRNQFSVCLYEANNGGAKEFNKLSAEDQGWVRESERDDVDMMSVDGSDDDKEKDELVERFASLGDAKSGVRVGGSREGADGDDDEDASTKNSHLAVGYANERAFVVRGTRMGVFKTGEDGMDYQSMLSFQNKGKMAFTPSQILLHEQDSNMLLLDPSNPNSVMRMDLERGAVVDEWSGLASGVSNISRTEKYANLTPNPEFLGLNQNGLMRMDPRTKELIVQSKNYAKGTRAQLSSMASTGSGYVAVASDNGDIRLYDQIGKNAKTYLPGLGVKIKSVDVTEDGSFVLATTKDFLMLIDTRVHGEEKGGFLKSMGKNKPPPIRLSLRPEDVIAHRIRDVDFTPAHFNAGSSLESYILTSTGPFIIKWNLRQVKLGRKNAYQIKRYRDDVVADEFAYNSLQKIVCVLPNDVTANVLR